MKQRESAGTGKLDRKMFDSRTAPAASRPLRRAAITGMLAASLAVAGVLCIGIPGRTRNTNNAAVLNQGTATAASSTPRLVDTAYPVPYSPAKDADSAALIAKGKQLYQAHTCSACHGPKAQGTAIAPPLAGIGHYFPESTFSALIHHPNSQMTSKGMPPAPLSDTQTHALWTYLNSMPVPAHRAPGVPAVVIFKKTAARAPKSTTPSHAIASVRPQRRTGSASA